MIDLLRWVINGGVSKSKALRCLLMASLLLCLTVRADTAREIPAGSVLIINMDMPILPGAQSLLERALKEAEAASAKAVVVYLDTPGGVLTTAQEMTQLLLRSTIPVVVYVAPQGSSATSAGAFILMAAHIAAMAPGTTVGAAHPVSSDGKDIQGDMRAKAENFAASMAKAIAETRGRNTEWAEKSVKESSSITESEALKLNVIDLVAANLDELFTKARGREIKNGKDIIVFPDLTSAPRVTVELNFQERAINFLADPNVVALLWLAATTGISIELYHPGAVLPGVVGVICLILALSVSQIIPISSGALALLLVGAIMIGLELYVASGVLGIGGIIAMVLGAVYLIDVTEAPGLSVSLELILPSAILVGALLFLVTFMVARLSKRRGSTGSEGMIGQRGVALENVAVSGRVAVHGESWKAQSVAGIIAKDSAVEVVAVRDGLILEVKEL